MTQKTRQRNELAALELFSDCSKSELDQIRHLLTGIEIPPGAVLMHEGTIGHEFIVIADGKARVTKDTDELAVLGSGSFVGEMALLDQVRRTATVTTVTGLRAYVSTSQEFRAILRAAPSVAEKITFAATDRARHQTAA